MTQYTRLMHRQTGRRQTTYDDNRRTLQASKESLMSMNIEQKHVCSTFQLQRLVQKTVRSLIILGKVI